MKQLEMNCPNDRKVKCINHNVIEKKRKDRLKLAIHEIRKVIPGSVLPVKKSTHCDVLEKTCEYIKALEEENRRLLRGDNCDVRAEIIERLRKEKEELANEKQHLLEILESSGPHLAVAAKWKTKSTNAMIPNIENLELFNASHTAAPKSCGDDSNAAIAEASVISNEGSSNVPKSFAANVENGADHDISVRIENNSHANCENSSTKCNTSAVISDKILALNGSFVSSAVHETLAVCKDKVALVSGPSEVENVEKCFTNPRKPKRTISHYLSEKRTLEHPVANVMQTNHLASTYSSSLTASSSSFVLASDGAANGTKVSAFHTLSCSAPLLAVVGSYCTPSLSTVGHHLIQSKDSCHVQEDSVNSAVTSGGMAETSATDNIFLRVEDDVLSPNLFQLLPETSVQSLSVIEDKENDLDTMNSTERLTKISSMISSMGDRDKLGLSTSGSGVFEMLPMSQNMKDNHVDGNVFCFMCKTHQDITGLSNKNMQRKILRRCRSSEELHSYLNKEGYTDSCSFEVSKRPSVCENESSETLQIKTGRTVDPVNYQKSGMDSTQQEKIEQSDSPIESREKLQIDDFLIREIVNSEKLGQCVKNGTTTDKVMDSEPLSTLSDSLMPTCTALGQSKPVSIQVQFVNNVEPADLLVNKLTPYATLDVLGIGERVTDVVSKSPSISLRNSDNKVIGLYNASRLSVDPSYDMQGKKYIYQNGCVFVMSDTGQNWLPVTTSALLNVQNNSWLPNLFPSGFTNPSYGHAVPPVQLLGSLNAVVLPSVNQPLAVYLPSNQFMSGTSQPSFASSVIVPYQQLSVVVTQAASISSVFPFCSVLSTSRDFGSSKTGQEAYVANGYYEPDSGPLSNSSSTALIPGNIDTVVVVDSHCQSSAVSTSSNSDDAERNCDNAFHSMKSLPLISVSEVARQDFPLENSQILQAKRCKTFKRKLSSCFSVENEVACRKVRMDSSVSTEVLDLNFETPLTSCDDHVANDSCSSATSDVQSNLLVGLSKDEGCSDFSSRAGGINSDHKGNVEQCLERDIVNLFTATNPHNSSMSDKRNAGGNLSMEHHNGAMVGSAKNSIPDKSVTFQSLASDVAVVCNESELVGNACSSTSDKDLVESFPFVATDIMKQSTWPLEPGKQTSENLEELPVDKLSEFSELRSSHWESNTPAQQGSDTRLAQELNKETSSGVYSHRFTTPLEPLSHLPSSRIETEHRMAACTDTLQSNEIGKSVEEPISSLRINSCSSSKTLGTSSPGHSLTIASKFQASGDSLVNQGSCTSHTAKALSYQEDKLNQSSLLSQEHWLNDGSYRTSLLRPFDIDSETLDKQIWTPVLDIGRSNGFQRRNVNAVNERTSCQPLKTSKNQKKKCTSKVSGVREMTSKSVLSQENAEIFSFGTSSLQLKDFTLSSFLTPPVPPFMLKQSKESLPDAVDKSEELKEIYQAPKSKPSNSSNLVVMASNEVADIITENDGNVDKPSIESFNEDSSNVLSEELSFPDNDDFSCMSLDDMVKMIDTNPVQGKPANQGKNTVAAWHQDLFGSARKTKLRDKSNLEVNRSSDLDDRYSIQNRQELFGFSADVYSEQDDLNSTAIGNFSNVLLNRKATSSTSSWQLPLFSDSLSTPEKCSYLPTSDHSFNSRSSSNYAGSSLYIVSDSLNTTSASTQVTMTSSARQKSVSSSGIFCLAQHAVPEKSHSSNNHFTNGYNYDFSNCLKDFCGTCNVESNRKNLESSLGIRNRSFPDYNFSFCGNDLLPEKSYSGTMSGTENCLWTSYGTKEPGKRICTSTSSPAPVVSSVRQLSFRPQVEVEYSNETPRSKEIFLPTSSSFLSHISSEKDGRPSTTLSAAIPAVDGLAYASWNDRMKDQGFLSTHLDPWKSSYCSSSSWRLATHEVPSSKNEVSASSSTNCMELNGIAPERFHFSISNSALSSTASGLPTFSLACLPLEHNSFSFNLSSVPDMNAADVDVNSHCSQEKRNPFMFYPLDHNEDELHHDISLIRPSLSPTVSTHDAPSNFVFDGCEILSKNYDSLRSGAEHLQHRGSLKPGPSNLTKPLPSFFNIASYTLKDKLPTTSSSGAFLQSRDVSSSYSSAHASPATVTYNTPFPHASYASSCSLNAYPQNFYHHGTGFPGPLTSPPLHHPPLCDRRLNTEQQPRFDSSFSLRNLQFPPMINFVPPPPPPPPTGPAFDPSVVQFQSHDVDNLATVCHSDNTKNRMFHLGDNRNSKAILSRQDTQGNHTAVSGESSRSSKSGTKKSSRSSKKSSSKLPVFTDRSLFENPQAMTPYFSISNFSPNKNPNSDIPTYFPSNPFRSEPGSGATSLNHKDYQGSSSFNPLLSGPQVSLNLRQPPPGFIISSSSTSMMTRTSSVPVLPPIHNFGFSNLFADLNNPTVLGGDGMSISPVKFAKGVPSILPSQTNLSSSSLHHQPISKIPSVFSTRTPGSPPPSALANMSINSLLGHPHQRFDEARTFIPATTATFVSGDASSTSFGLYRP